MMAFLTLPAEIRENIYVHMFQNTALCFLKSNTDTEKDTFVCRSIRDIQLPRQQLQAAARETPNILLTCRTCYNEAHNIFTSTITFVVFNRYHLSLSHLKLASSNLITNLQTIQTRSWILPSIPLDSQLKWPSLKIVDAGKFWFTKFSYRQDFPQLLHNTQNNPRVDKKILRVTAHCELDYLLRQVTHSPNLTFKVFVTIACKAIYPGSRNGSHCIQCHGDILHYWTMQVDTKKVFRCFSTKLDVRIARAVLLGIITPQETGLLEPRPQACRFEPGVHRRQRARIYDAENAVDKEILYSAKVL